MSLEILCFQICMLRQRAHRRRTCCTYQVKNLNTVIFPSFGLSFQYFFGQHHCSVVDPYLDPFWICIQQLSGSVYGIQIRIHTWLKLGCPNFGYKQISLRSETKGNRNSFVSLQFRTCLVTSQESSSGPFRWLIWGSQNQLLFKEKFPEPDCEHWFLQAFLQHRSIRRFASKQLEDLCW